MASFIFRCPNTGLNVQGWVAEDPTERGREIKEIYEAITCTACTRLHVVSPATGKVLGADDD